MITDRRTTMEQQYPFAECFGETIALTGHPETYLEQIIGYFNILGLMTNVKHLLDTRTTMGHEVARLFIPDEDPGLVIEIDIQLLEYVVIEGNDYQENQWERGVLGVILTTLDRVFADYKQAHYRVLH